ncbi:hypothetical protein TNCV_1475891 [Trichonephila clavipes]|nr:hypothetical protein TNCV_1475891 [Trichonephila clavipes]
MYGRTNGKGRAALRMFHAQCPDRRMADHRIFQRLHRHLRETRFFHVTRNDAGRQRLEESMLNVVADRPESNARAVADHASVKHQTVCSVKRKSLTHLLFLASTSFESDRPSSPTVSG